MLGFNLVTAGLLVAQGFQPTASWAWTAALATSALGAIVLILSLINTSKINRVGNDRQAFVKDVLTSISKLSTAPDADAVTNEAIETILTHTATHLKVERVSYWIFPESHTEMTCKLCYIASTATFESDQVLNAADYPRYFEALEDDHLIDAGSAHTDPRTSEFSEGYLTPLGITSMLDTKVILENRTTGIICIEHIGTMRRWTTSEKAYATTSANLIAILNNALLSRRMGEQLSEERDKAQASDRAKSSFLANMSHEIRTPLNGVIGMANVVKSDDTLSDKQVERLGIIAESGEILLELLNNILDISKIEASQMSLETVPFDLEHLMERATATWDQLATPKGLTLQIDTSHAFQPIIASDPTRLRQILMNLVGNAIKFTHEGHIRLRVSQDILDNLVIQTTFAIEDTGIGIAEDQLENIFVNFGQADPSTTRQFGGTGLGLAISRRLARQMGGDIEVSSVEGKGSVFSLSITSSMVAAETAPVALPERDGLVG
jgi:signal transduction histidine kinase